MRLNQLRKLKFEWIQILKQEEKVGKAKRLKFCEVEIDIDSPMLGGIFQVERYENGRG